MWREAKPTVIKLLAHLVIFMVAAFCVAIILIITYGLLLLCDMLFKNNEFYIKAALIIGEVFLFYYILQFTQKRSGVPSRQ